MTDLAALVGGMLLGAGGSLRVSSLSVVEENKERVEEMQLTPRPARVRHRPCK